MEQFSFRYGANELWLGVGVTAAWTVVMAGATFLALIFLDREPFSLSPAPSIIAAPALKAAALKQGGRLGSLLVVRE